MAIATLSIDMVAKLGELQAGMDRAGRISEQTAARIESRYQRMADVSRNVGAALGSSLAVERVAAFFKTTVDGLDALNDLSDATGATVENLSALEDIAARAGARMDVAGDALLKFNKLLAEAREPGSNAARIFTGLGLSVEGLLKADPTESFRRVAIALSQYANDADKARLVQELFGKSTKDVAALLNDLAAAGSSNATVTREQAEEAAEFNRQLAAFVKNGEDAARAITSALLPTINKFLADTQSASDSTLSWGERLRALNRIAGNSGFGISVPFFGTESDPAAELASVRTELQAIETALQRQDISAQRRADLERKRIGRLETISKLERQAAGSFRPSQNYGDTAPSVPVISKPSPRLAAAIAQPLSIPLDPAVQRAAQAIQATDIVRLQEINGALEQLFTQRASGLGGGPEIDQAIENLRDELQKLDPASKAAAAAQAELNALLAATPSGQMAALAQQASVLAIELAKATDPERVAQLTQSLEQTGEKMRGLGERVVPVTAQLSEFAQQAARNIQDALGDSLLQGLEGKFETIGELWANLLKRMAAQALAAQLNRAILGENFAKTGQIGGGAASLIKLLPGMANFSGFFATGGRIPAGQWGIAGEAGPEVVHGPATVIPMGGRGAGGPVVNQTNYFGSNVSRGEVALAAAQAKDAAVAEIRALMFRTGRGAL